MIGYAIFIATVAIATSCISYATMADSKGWPVGEILAKDASTPKIVAFLAVLWVVVKSFIVFHWWSPLLVLVAGWFAAFLLTMALKKNVQFLCIIGVFPALAATILYISEEKPLGFLTSIFS